MRALGMESGAIADSQITASSEVNAYHNPRRARLYTKETDDYSSGAWSSLTGDLNQWLQVDLGKTTPVTHVATQGRNSWSPAQMVTKYKLQFSNDGASFLFYKRHGESLDAVLEGNTDHDTVVYHHLNPPITTRFIRIKPTEWQVHIAMRLELYTYRVAVGEHVLARWTNNLYYTGKVSSTEGGNIHVIFDGGNEITHKVQDVTAVIKNSPILHVRIGQHVLAKWHGGVKYYIGYVTAEVPNEQYTVTFDDNDEASYLAAQLTEFPAQYSPHVEGARVFARWTNSLYYRGFVTVVSSTTVNVKYDDGNTIKFMKSDHEAMIADRLLCYSQVSPGMRVIGFWPGQTRYYPGVVQSREATGSLECFQKQVYNVAFDDGDRRKEDFNQIRLVP